MIRFLIIFILGWPLLTQGESMGPTVLTVFGAIENTNRGPLDRFRDPLLARYTKGFEGAYTFSRANLKALPQHSLKTHYPGWEKEHTFSGPRIADVLAAAGGQGTSVRFFALDGFSISYERDVLEQTEFILALDMDGEPLGIGGFGPAYMMVSEKFTQVFPDGNPNDDYLVWGVIMIEVR